MPMERFPKLLEAGSTVAEIDRMAAAIPHNLIE